MPVKTAPPVTMLCRDVTCNVSTSDDLLEQGRNLYSLGRFTEAVTVWQRASQQYRSQGERYDEDT